LSRGEITPQRPREHYWSREYNTKWRICSFFHQVDELVELGAESVLEIGPGSGMVTDWLRRAGIEVTTLDVDPALEADVHGTVTELPFEADAFDAVLCSQVLEHLPFAESETALAEIARVARLGTVISLPDSTPWAGISAPVFFGYHSDLVRRRMPPTRRALLGMLLRREIRLRDYLYVRLVPAHWTYPGYVRELKHPPVPHGPWRLPEGDDHSWEIGVAGTPPDRLLAAFDAAGLSLQRDFRLPEYPWHHFFILRPSSWKG
jgi:SAM-dependent methyltransferase